MKKLLLSSAILAIITFGINAQNYEWDFGNDITNFPIAGGYSVETVINGLTITPGSTTNMGQVEKSNKSFGEKSYENRFKFNGAGYTGANVADVTPLVNMPTQRYISFSVNGGVDILAHGITGSSAQDRRVFVTDGTNLIGSLVFLAGSEISEQTVSYTGDAATLYLYCNQAVNLYYLKVTQKSGSSISDIDADKGAVVSETYYNVLGKEVSAESKGLVIKKVTYENGEIQTTKNIFK